MFKLSENMFKSILFYTFLIGIGFSGVSCEDKTIPSVRGETITLTCPIDITSCGELHSVKWFKGNERVAVVSGDGEVANVEGGYSDRMSIDHSPTGPETRLRLSNIQISDEETYLCESTFLDPMESCDSSGAYSIDLKVLVPPEEIIVLDHKGNTLTNGSVLGPLRVGQTLTATCEAKRARPEPTVGWYRAGKKLSDSFEIDQSEGLYNIKSELKLVLAREDLGSVIECRIETPALENIYTNQMMLDIQVSPTKIQLSGFKHHTVQGNKVLLHCQVVGARPPANVTWYNGTQIIDPLQSEPANIKTEMYPQSDRTYETVSQLIFTASRYENMISLKCIADNIVIRDNHEEPLHSGITLEVMYLPVVTVSPDSRTVNETSEVILFCNYDSNPASLTKVKWYKNDMPINANQSRYNGGHPELPALIIKNATKDDIGNYTCELANSVGQSISENQIELDVHYVPIVELIMSPDVPIIENDKGNVTLNCHVIDGNPTKLIKVKWFLDGTLLKELPECYDDNSTSCNFESNVIFLTNVDRTFKGNYSCEGHNSAGLGPRSDDSELIVYYEPGVASISHFPTIPVKRKSVTFECNVTDYGNPIATRYRWLRGGKSVLDVISKMWAVDPVLLDTRTNFSCFAYNEGGDGEAATVALDVHAPPAFIQKLPPYVGFLYSDSIINLTCRIECVPTCSISWFKDGLAIEDSNEKYYIKESYLPARNETGDFEGVLSILYFNMTAWPDERLDIFRDNGNYSCASSNNSIGRGVSSDTYFGVEYPPENTTSEAVVEIQEGSMLPSVICKAKAYPPPQFEWRHNDEILATSSALIINKEFYRKDSGTYNCISHNRHGSLTSDTYVNVTYKPDCKIERREIDNEDVLVCTAEANPLVVDFAWSVKSENDTIENLNVRENGHQGFLILDHDFSVMRTYRCVANNSVGLGTSCEIIVEVEPLCCTTVRPKRHLPWWQRWDLTTLIIVITSVVAILLAVLIVCCIIICICRKRRRQDKYHTDITISSTQSAYPEIQNHEHSTIIEQPQLPSSTISLSSTQLPPLNTTTSLTTYQITEVPKSPPKWPLRPGVMVHVKVDTKQNLCAARIQSPSIINLETSDTNIPTNSIHNISYASPILKNNTNTNSRDTSLNMDALCCYDTQEQPQQQHELNQTILPELPNRNNNLFVENQQIVGPTIITTNMNILQNINAETQNDNDDDDDHVNQQIVDDTNNNNNNYLQNDELYNFTNSNLIERILGRLRWRRDRIIKEKRNKSPTILIKSNKRAVNLLRSTGWFGSGKSTTSSTGLFDDSRRRRRLPNGVQCTDGVVTYKKTPIFVRPVTTTDANQLDTTETRKRKLSNSNPVKSSMAEDPLTEPGAYENLPFHGLQSAPNKPYINTNTTNSNVVRVAPRTKNPQQQKQLQQQQQQQQLQTTNNYNHNIANNFPSNFPSNFYPNNSNFPNFIVHSLNYPNYPITQQQQQQLQLQQFQHGPSTSTSSTSTSSIIKLKNGLIKNTQSQSHLSSTSYNPFLVKTNDTKNTNDKKFNSLKSLGVKKSPQFYSMRINKCRRHHNNNNNNNNNSNNINNNNNNNNSNTFIDINNKNSISTTLPYVTNNKLNHHHQLHNNYEQQPLYENLTDSIQIHELSLQNDCSYVDYNLMNEQQERNSIYRSDSGISNSSYECITPVPAPRTVQRKCQSAPVYMNLPNSSKNYYRHNNKCKANIQNPAFINYERNQTNPFVTTSRRQQILVPKELFPNQPHSSSIKATTIPITPTTIANQSSSSSSSSRRPVKLPLRKHHSFHFQSSQTVTSSSGNKQKKCYKNNGPLVFKPFNEKSAFKPITPVPKSPNKQTIINKTSTTTTTTPPPRVCGTSLKRHMSNIETMNSNRLRENYTLKDTSDDNDEHDDNNSTTNGSSSSYVLRSNNSNNLINNNSNNSNNKRIVYADLAPLNSSSSDKSVDEQIKLKNLTDNITTTNNKRSTQYATLKFNEVNI